MPSTCGDSLPIVRCVRFVCACMLLEKKGVNIMLLLLMMICMIKVNKTAIFGVYIFGYDCLPLRTLMIVFKLIKGSFRFTRSLVGPYQSFS